MLNCLRKSLAVLLLAALVGEAALADGVGESTSFKGPVGLQLYSLRDMQKAEGVAAVLDKAKALGFKYVEVASLSDLSPAQFKAELDRRGLVPIGRHYPYGQLRDDIGAVVRDAKALGLPYAGCAWIDHKSPFDEKQCREAIRVFNRAGAALAKEGIHFYYHNHGYEFEPLGQGTVFDLLVAKTDPKNVSFQMDVMWTVVPGQDPVQLLKKYPHRWVLFHLKDLKKGVATGSFPGKVTVNDDVALGTGQVDWPAVLRTAQDVGVKYYFIEDESPSVVEQLPRSLRYLESCNW